MVQGELTEILEIYAPFLILAVIFLMVLLLLIYWILRLKSSAGILTQDLLRQEEELNKLNQELVSSRDLVTALKEENSGLNARISADQESRERELAYLKQSHSRELEELRKSRDESLLAQEKSSREALDAQKRASQEAFVALERRFNEIVNRTTLEMREAATGMLKERQKEFTDSSTESLDKILGPLKFSLDGMHQALDKSSQCSNQMFGMLKGGIESVLKQSELARNSADELARALRGTSKIQGDWGEMILNELLASQGLTEGIHYEVQPWIRNRDGTLVKTEDKHAMRPDVIIHLDDVRDVIVDSKVSLTAYVNYVNASSEDERRVALNSHIESVKKHIQELSKKNYSSYIKHPRESLDFVIMFIPNEGAFQSALTEKPDLWRQALDQKVYLADERSLCAALKIVSLMWTHAVQEQNHRKIFELAEEMLDRVGAFAGELTKLGQSINKSQESYSNAMRKLQNGKFSIGATCSKLMELGAGCSDGSVKGQAVQSLVENSRSSSSMSPVLLEKSEHPA